MGCCVPSKDAAPDEKIVEVYLHHGYADEVNTFNGTLVKDLIPGTVEIPFSFTRREQEIILSNAERLKFFTFPDTIFRQPEETIAPDFGAQTIRIRSGAYDKTVVWFEPHDKNFKYYPLLIDLEKLIMSIVISKPEYKALPPTKGGYL